MTFILTGVGGARGHGLVYAIVGHPVGDTGTYGGRTDTGTCIRT